MMDLKTWALSLWENVKQGKNSEPENSEPVGQPPSSPPGKAEYDCVALQTEVTTLQAKMSSQRVRPASYNATLEAAGISVEPGDVIDANRTEVLITTGTLKSLCCIISLPPS